MSKKFDITKIKNCDEYCKKNIVMDEEKDILHNIHENVKKSEFKDYEALRKYLIDNNFVDCIIQLPDNLFFGTGIATCIMVLKKSKKDNSTLFIDATKECVKVTNNNKLTDENIENVVKIFTDRKDVDYVSKLVSNKEIGENNYNLSVSTYVEKEDTREKIDIDVLNKEIDEIVARENVLREEIKKIISEIEV